MKQSLHKRVSQLEFVNFGGARSKVKVKCRSYLFYLDNFIHTGI